MIQTLVAKHESKFLRLFEILPGLLIWILLLSPIWAGPVFSTLFGSPKLVLDIYGGFIIVLAVYWFLRASLTMIGTAIGFIRYKQALSVNWLQRSLDLQRQELPSPESLPVGQFLPKHLLVYPVGAAEYDVLARTLDGIRNQNYPLELLYVAISMEERLIRRNPEYFAKMQTDIKQNFPEFGDRLMIFEHPDGLTGEVIGAAANRTWGAKNAVSELTGRGESIGDFLITSPDEDIVFHPQYLAAATYQYLISPYRKQRFYQTALYTFNNNYWDVPMLIRVLSASLTIPVLASSVTEKYKRETFSCYTLGLDVLAEVGYWDVHLGIDDTTFFWKPYFHFKGDWECEVFFIPLMADAVYHPNYVRNHREQYKQYVRWGWGVISVPMAAVGLLKYPGIPLAHRLEKLIHIFQVFVLWKVMVYLLTFAIPGFFLLNSQYSILVDWYAIPNTLSQIMGIAVVFIFPTTLFKGLLAPPYPSNWSKLKYFGIMLIEAPLNILTILTFSFAPFIEASTRYMFGQKPFKMVTWTEKEIAKK